MDWSDGYVADIPYISGFYRELAPSYLSLAARLHGQRAPDPAQPFRYAELGCGHGLGTNLLAAANPHGWFLGLDLLPAHIANARELAADAGLENIRLSEASFQEAAAWPDDALPALDYIVLHGIYAWISPENRAAIRRFIQRFLRPGGLVYVSYNAMPGWAALTPLQRLLREHADRNPGRSDRQIDEALAFVERLREAGAGYFAQHPPVGEKIDGLGAGADRAYLAHEYLNRASEPLYVTDAAAEMATARLDYAGSAHLLEAFRTLSVPASLRPVLDETADPLLRELLRDYAVNRLFRRDLFIKGARSATATEQDAALLDTPLAPLLPREEMSTAFTAPVGEMAGEARIYTPIMDRLARGTWRLRELHEATGLPVPELIQACAVLTASGQAHPAVPGGDPEPARRLNAVLAERFRRDEPQCHLAAPAVGSALSVTDSEVLALDELRRDAPGSARALARTLWREFCAVDRRLVRDGAVLEAEADNLAELRRRGDDILRRRAPVWRGLGLLD